MPLYVAIIEDTVVAVNEDAADKIIRARRGRDINIKSIKEVNP